MPMDRPCLVSLNDTISNSDNTASNERIIIFIQCQSHIATLTFLLYRQLVSALVFSHHQALSKKKDTEKEDRVIDRLLFLKDVEGR